MDGARYIETTTPAVAAAVQAAFLALSYAEPPVGVDRFFSEVVKYDDPSRVALCVKMQEKFWILADAPLHQFDPILQPYVDAGLMPADEIAKINDRVRLFAGTGVSLYVYNMFPQLFRQSAKTEEQLREDGWFPPDPVES